MLLWIFTSIADIVLVRWVNGLIDRHQQKKRRLGKPAHNNRPRKKQRSWHFMQMIKKGYRVYDAYFFLNPCITGNAHDTSPAVFSVLSKKPMNRASMERLNALELLSDGYVVEQGDIPANPAVGMKLPKAKKACRKNDGRQNRREERRWRRPCDSDCVANRITNAPHRTPRKTTCLA